VREWRGKIIVAPERKGDSSRQKRTARERERQLEREEDGRDRCFVESTNVDSTARLVDGRGASAAPRGWQWL